jgi:hypothetical protein
MTARPRLSAPGFSLVDLRSTIAPGMRRSNRALCWMPLSSTQNADSSEDAVVAEQQGCRGLVLATASRIANA